MESKQATHLKIKAVFTERRSLCLRYMPTGFDWFVSQVWKPQVVGIRLHSGYFVPLLLLSALVDPALRICPIA